MTQTTPLNIVKDQNGVPTYGRSVSNQIYSATLSANTNTTIAVPADISTGLAIITPTPGGSIYVALNTAATPPAGASFALTSSEFNPSPLRVKGGSNPDVLNILTTDTTCDVTVSFGSQVS